MAQIASQLWLRDWAKSDADPSSDLARRFAWRVSIALDRPDRRRVYAIVCAASVLFEVARMSVFVREASSLPTLTT